LTGNKNFKHLDFVPFIDKMIFSLEHDVKITSFIKWKFKKLYGKFYVAMTLLQQKHQSQENSSILDVINRFGNITEQEIDENVIKSVPRNMEKSKNSVWRQFYVILRRKKVHISSGDSSIDFK
jgi:hypothetical protein